MLIWSGTWKFSANDIEQVTAASAASFYALASEKSPAGYQRVAASFDGNAYYWSSAGPGGQRWVHGKLTAMAATVHAAGGLWIAPFAPGFDARMVGGHARGAPSQRRHAAGGVPRRHLLHPRRVGTNLVERVQ